MRKWIMCLKNAIGEEINTGILEYVPIKCDSEDFLKVMSFILDGNQHRYYADYPD